MAITTAPIENYEAAIRYKGGINTNLPAQFGAGVTFGAATLFGHTTTAAVPATATATAVQTATGYITSTSAAATTITLPTGTALGAQISAVQGTVLELYVDNTAGANTVTMAVNTGAALSAAAVAGAGAGFGLLTIPAGATGVARFTLMFSSPTAYVITRTA